MSPLIPSFVFTNPDLFFFFLVNIFWFSGGGLLLEKLCSMLKRFFFLVSIWDYLLILSFVLTLNCRFDNLIFMNSRLTETSVVSCKSGNNNNNLFFWILFCLLPKFLGTPFAYGNFLLLKAIDRSPSAVRVL